MKIIVRHPSGNAQTLMRRAGYVFQRRDGAEMSFVRELARSGYPRFHAYVRTEGIDILVNAHLDMKRETYGDTTRHHGEYDSDGPLKDEIGRILPILGDGAEIIP